MIPQLPVPSLIDPEIALRLPLSAWIVVWQHLARGSYTDVAAIIGALDLQTAQQIEALGRALMEQAAAAEAQKVAEISQPASTLN